MLGQFARGRPARKCNQDNLYPALASEFHSWHAVGIRSHQTNPVHISQCGISGDIKADSHIDTLLLEIGFEIGIGQGGNSRHWSSF